MKTIVLGLVLGATVTVTGCDDGKPVTKFCYGCDMPGSLLPEGGEALLERVYMSPAIAQAEAPVITNQFHAYHYTGDFIGAADLPPPGRCAKWGPDTFQVHDIPGDGTAVYTDFGAELTLSGPGLGEDGLTVPKVVAGADGIIDNRFSPWRLHDEGNFIYGGPDWQWSDDASALAFQNSELVAEELYTLDIENITGDDVTFNMPRSYEFPLGIGTNEVEMTITDPESGFEITWAPLLNPPDAPHSRTHDFTFVAFAGLEDPENIWVCRSGDGQDGSITLPPELLADIEDVGIIQAGRSTHYMDNVDGRKFDAMAIWCGISIYSKVEN